MRKLLLLSAVCILYCATVLPYRTPALPLGERYTLYLNSASSQATILVTDRPFWDKLTAANVMGESCEIAATDYQRILNELGATLLFCETAGNVTNYYCSCERLPYRISINGYTVNLHVAVADGRACLGTPIIFGGY